MDLNAMRIRAQANEEQAMLLVLELTHKKLCERHSWCKHITTVETDNRKCLLSWMLHYGDFSIVMRILEIMCPIIPGGDISAWGDRPSVSKREVLGLIERVIMRIQDKE